MAENNVKVSVIMPVYNTQDFVREAIRCITGQTLREIEIVIVDDGSTDSSPRILREEAEKDSRIKVYTQPNQGQSVARNTGLTKISGEYIYFMDSDDLLEPSALEECYNKCKANDLDLVNFEADVFGDENDPLFCDNYYHLEVEDRVYKGTELMGILLGKHCFCVPVWMNMIRREFLEGTGLRFYPGIIHEDDLFTTICFAEARKVGVIAKPFFKRRIRGGSTMSTKFGWRNMTGYFTVTDELMAYRKGKDREVKGLIDTFTARMLNTAVYKAYVMPLGDRIRIAWRCVLKYHNYVRFNTLAVLLLKRPMKQFFRK